MVQYVTQKYEHVLKSTSESVSVHFRLGLNASELLPSLYSSGRHPLDAWYIHVMTTQFVGKNVTFLLFTDNIARLESILSDAAESIKDLHYVIIDEDFASSMLLMTLCQHHVIGTSSFGFWGAYLDTKQPTGGLTIIPPEYKEAFFCDPPYGEWKVVEPPFVLKWQQIPVGFPLNIVSEEEISSMEFISPILMGGLGNILFQLAAAHTLALQRNVPCIVAWWDQYPYALASEFRPFGGYPPPAPGITLKSIFPSIRYVDFFPKHRETWANLFHSPVAYEAFPRPLATPFVHGLFYDPKCLMFAFARSSF